MAFKETDKTLFIGRREDGTIYGTWTVRQWDDQEEALETNPEVVAFTTRPQRKPADPKPSSKIIDPRLSQEVIDMTSVKSDG